jgi:NAD(P)-dependent dehydrogenase (short-subunit alcohol dehydrogenase family)
MLLERKNAVTYGGGTIGGAVARAFAREGAAVHLTGRTLAKLEQVAGDIRQHGGTATVAQVEIEDLGDYPVAARSILPDDHQEAWIPFHTPSGRRIERWAFPATTNELAVLVSRDKVVAPTLPTAPYFGLPNIVRIPILDVPAVRVVLATLPGASDPRRDEFIRVAREITREPTT